MDRSMKRIALPVLAFLTACGTPQEQCISYNTRDLRVVDRLIAEVEGNLDRGYAIETVTITREYWTLCHPGPGVEGEPARSPERCLVDRDYDVERPKAIDLAAEAQKLEGLRQKRAELARNAQAVIAECQAKYPE